MGRKGVGDVVCGTVGVGRKGTEALVQIPVASLRLVE